LVGDVPAARSYVTHFEAGELRQHRHYDHHDADQPADHQYNWHG
jgi:hypothetical protein